MEYSVEIGLSASCTGKNARGSLALRQAWLLFHAIFGERKDGRSRLVVTILLLNWPVGESLPWIETVEIEDGHPTHLFLNC